MDDRAKSRAEAIEAAAWSLCADHENRNEDCALSDALKDALELPTPNPSTAENPADNFSATAAEAVRKAWGVMRNRVCRAVAGAAHKAGLYPFATTREKDIFDACHGACLDAFDAAGCRGASTMSPEAVAYRGACVALAEGAMLPVYGSSEDVALRNAQLWPNHLSMGALRQAASRARVVLRKAEAEQEDARV